jgi:hypothetical protein
MQILRPALAALLLVSPFAANGTLIDFDDLAEGTPLTDQYADLGVTFSGIENNARQTPDVRGATYSSVPHSGPNFLTNFFDGSVFPDKRLDFLVIDFDGIADNVSLWLNMAEAPDQDLTLGVRLFDENDVLFDTVALAGSDTGNVFYSLGSGIGRIEARQPRDTWWWAMDDLSFDLTRPPGPDPTPVPEPGTLALFGLGLFGLGLARRRKKTV